jgi:alcohol dehydrogenase (cytochrome c)
MILPVVGVLLTVGAIAVIVLYGYWGKAVPLAGVAINFVRTLTAPSGTTTTEEAVSSTGTEAPMNAPTAATVPAISADDWPGYNKTITSERDSPLSQVNTANISRLRVLCTYDTRQYTAFEPGLIVVDGAMIGTTEHDMFSLDPATCRENWRTHEDYIYTANGEQKGAAAVGFTSSLRPTEAVTGKVVILGLGEAHL